MNRLFEIIFTALSVVSASAVMGQDVVSYSDHVRPMLGQHCFACHNADRQRGGLDLSSYSALMAGGSSGEIVSPQDPEGSSLMGVLSHAMQPAMPPDQPRLDDDKIEIVRQWITQGCRENTDSAARVASGPRVDLSVGEPTLGRPEGPPLMPEDMPLGPIVQTPRAGAITALAGHPWSPIVAVGGQRQILIYHTQTLELLGVLPFEPGQPQTICFSGSGQLLLAGGGIGGQSGSVVVWDVRTGNEVARVGEEVDSVLAADIDAMQRFVALGGPSRVVKVYDVAGGEPIYRITKHTEWITALAFSPDGILLATADRNGGLYIWEAATGELFYTLEGHDQQITDLAWRYDGNVLASTSEDGQVRLWEMHAGQRVKNWEAHRGGAQSVAFTEDGRLVTTGRDQRVKVWKPDGSLGRELRAFEDVGLSATFDTTGGRVFAGDITGRLVCWRLEEGDPVEAMGVCPASVATALTQAQEAVAQVQREIAPAQARYNEAQTRLQARTRALTEAQARGVHDQANQDRIIAARQAYDQARQHQARQQQALHAHAVRMGAAQQEVAKWRAAQLRIQIDLQRDQLAQARSAEHPTRQALDQAVAHRDQAQAQQIAAQAAIDAAPPRVEAKRQRLAATRQTAQQIQGRIDQQQQAITQAGAEVQTQQAALQALLTQAAAMESPDAQTTADIAQARQQLADMEAREGQAAHVLDEIQLELEDAEFEVESAQAGLHRIEQEVAALPAQLEAYDQQLAQAQAQIDNARQAASVAAQPSDALEAQIQELMIRYREYRAAAGFIQPGE